MSAIKDCLNRIIMLTDERIQHIKKNHPEFNPDDFDEKIINTLQAPEHIILSLSDETVELYYKHFYGTPLAINGFVLL